MPMNPNVAIAAVGAGLAMGLAGIGSGIGVGITGAAGTGVIAEDPGKFGTAIVFQALPQTQAIYGLLTAILILLGTGLLAGAPKTDFNLLMGLACLGAGIGVGMAGLSAIGQGIAAASGVGITAEAPEMFGKGMVFSVLPETQAIYGLLTAILLLASTGVLAGAGIVAPYEDFYFFAGLAGVGAGVAVGLAGLSAIGQGIAASAGIGASREVPEIFGRGMVFSVLPETQAIYGLLIAILLLVFSGLLGTIKEVSPLVGVALIGAGASVGLAGLSGIGQGITAAGGIGAAAKEPGTMGKSLVLSVMSETFAIFGLLISILIMYGAGLFG